MLAAFSIKTLKARECCVNEAFLYIGLGIFILGGIGLLIAAFKTSMLWGFSVLILPPAAILYLIAHWQDAKGPFKIQIFGLLALAALAYKNEGTLIPTALSSAMPASILSAPATPGSSIKPSQTFRCDGRQHCSQMNSRAEAEFFTRNCPNTKMDGDRDGIPCENDSRF